MDSPWLYLKLLLLPFAVVGGITSLYLWKRHGFWAPRYIHIIALLAFAFGAFMAWQAWVLDHPQRDGLVWLAVILPAAVYLVFGYAGGGHLARDRASRSAPPAVNSRR